MKTISLMMFLSASFCALAQPIPPPVIYPITVVKGGTGGTTAPDDNLLIGTGAAWTRTTIPDCPDTGGNHLNYVQSTNSLSCGTSGGGGVAAPLTLTVADSATNTATAAPLTVQHTTSGTVAYGFGLSMPFILETSAGTNVTAVAQRAYWSSDADGSPDGIYAVQTAVNGTLTDAMTIDGFSRTTIFDGNNTTVRNTSDNPVFTVGPGFSDTRMSVAASSANSAPNIAFVTGGNARYLFTYHGDSSGYASLNGSIFHRTTTSGNSEAGNVGIGNQINGNESVTPSRLLSVYAQENVSNSYIYPFLTSCRYTGSPTAAGFACHSETSMEDSAGNNQVVGSYGFAYTDTTNTSEDADFSINTIDSGTVSERFRVTSDGHHLLTGVAASVGTCGTSPSISGNDSAGVVTLGSGGITSCVVTFAVAYGSAPVCTITPADAVTAAATPYITSATGSLTINFGSSVASGTVHYRCVQAQ